MMRIAMVTASAAGTLL